MTRAQIFGLLGVVAIGVAVFLAFRRRKTSEPVAVLRSPDGNPPHRSISEAIRLSKARGSNVTLDDAFGDDMEAIMRLNRQGGWPNA